MTSCSPSASCTVTPAPVLDQLPGASPKRAGVAMSQFRLVMARKPCGSASALSCSACHCCHCWAKPTRSMCWTVMFAPHGHWLSSLFLAQRDSGHLYFVLASGEAGVMGEQRDLSPVAQAELGQDPPVTAGGRARRASRGRSGCVPPPGDR